MGNQPALTEPTAAPKEGEEPKKEGEAAPAAEVDFTQLKLPEGFALDPELQTEAAGIFKDLGISQEGAQRLTDLQTKLMDRVNTQIRDAWNQTNQKWVDEIKADPKFGGDPADPNSNLSKALGSIASAIDNPKLTADPAAFREAIAMTGFGNNPAAIRTLATWANALTESGRHIEGSPPKASTAERSGASAIYPNLAP